MKSVNYKIFDIHTHAYPENISDRACSNLGKFYEFTVKYDGTLKELDTLETEGGAFGFLLFSVATIPGQVVKINDWLRDMRDNNSRENMRIYTLAAMHQEFPDKQAEVERVLKNGFKGVKIHPDFQGENADSEKFYPIYEALEGRGVVMLHAGDARYDFSNPERIVRVKKRYPNLDIIAAHLGGYQKWHLFEKIYSGSGIYIDTSSVFGFLEPERACEIISNYDGGKILFGTDYPIMSVKSSADALLSLGLSSDLYEKIFYKNACKLLNIV